MRPSVTGKRFLLALALALPSGGRADVHEVSVPPAGTEKYRSADFRLWLPYQIKFVRAVIVRQHGCGRKGLDHADDVQWRALAQKWDCALLGTHFQETKDCSDWCVPANGSERAFLAALDALAKKSGHPELASVPWALWGHSGGALWAVSLTNRHPDRVVAVFARSGAAGVTAEAARSVPVLFNYGAEEKTGRFARVHEGVMKVLDRKSVV